MPPPSPVPPTRATGAQVISRTSRRRNRSPAGEEATSAPCGQRSSCSCSSTVARLGGRAVPHGRTVLVIGPSTPPSSRARSPTRQPRPGPASRAGPRRHRLHRLRTRRHRAVLAGLPLRLIGTAWEVVARFAARSSASWAARIGISRRPSSGSSRGALPEDVGRHHDAHPAHQHQQQPDRSPELRCQHPPPVADPPGPPAPRRAHHRLPADPARASACSSAGRRRAAPMPSAGTTPATCP